MQQSMGTLPIAVMGTPTDRLPTHDAVQFVQMWKVQKIRIEKSLGVMFNTS